VAFVSPQTLNAEKWGREKEGTIHQRIHPAQQALLTSLFTCPLEIS
jgi:hypothetical protein